MGKDDLRVRRTKKLLFDSLFKLLRDKEQKLSEVSVQKICDEAMIHRSTFYKYYTDKYDLLFKELDFHSKFDKAASNDYILNPFQHMDKLNTEDNFKKIIENNKKDIYFQEHLTKQIHTVIVKNLQTQLKHIPSTLPIEIIVSVYDSTIITLIEYWIEHPDESVIQMDSYFRQVLHPFYFDVVETD